MDVKEIKKRIKEIRVAETSDLFQEGVDSLWTDVLEAISEGANNAQELAKEALKTMDIEWCPAECNQ